MPTTPIASVLIAEMAAHNIRFVEIGWPDSGAWPPSSEADVLPATVVLISASDPDVQPSQWAMLPSSVAIDEGQEIPLGHGPRVGSMGLGRRFPMRRG